jgi:gas vesicle protein
MVKIGNLHKFGERNSKKRKTVAKAAAGTFLVGSAVGAASGIIMAPDSGKKTRSKLKTKAKSSIVRGKSAGKDLKNSVHTKAAKASTSTTRAAKQPKKTAIKSTKTARSK